MLFEPSSKVQKDRNLIRETDYRMAKYGRRGLLLTVSVFVITLFVGQFFRANYALAIILAAGLFLLTLVRGYLMFGFDTIYPRAPTRWRTWFFTASLMGAAWWGIIVASITFTQGFEPETTLIWLYTAVFSAGMSFFIAPYRRFHSLYLLTSITPGVLASFLLGEIQGYFYGVIMSGLLIMLMNQGSLMGQSYWERLEANFALRKRAQALEQEKRDSMAAAQLSQDFLVSLGDEFRSAANDTVGVLTILSHDRDFPDDKRHLIALAERASDRQLSLIRSVLDYSLIKSHKLVLDSTVFNLPKLVERIFNEKEVDAELYDKELTLNFSKDMANRVRGDSLRTSHLIASLIDQAIAQTSCENLVAEVSCDVDSDDIALLKITITEEQGDSQQSPAGSSKQKTNCAKISTFAIGMSKQLVKAMGGEIGFREAKHNSFWLELPLTVVSSQPFVQQKTNIFDNQNILVVGAPAQIEQELTELLSIWGLDFETIKSDQWVGEFLETNTTDYDYVLIFSKKARLTALPVSERLLDNDRLAEAQQIIVVSQLQSESALLQQHLQEYPQVNVIQKPITQEKLLTALNENRSIAQVNDSVSILLVEDNSVDQQMISGLVEKFGYSVDVVDNPDSALSYLTRKDYDIVLMSCELGTGGDSSISERASESLRAFVDENERLCTLLGVTTRKNDQQHRIFVAAGLDDTLEKPVRKDELKKQLDHWLVNRQ